MVRRPVLSQVPAFLKQVRKYSTATAEPVTDEPVTSVSSAGGTEEGEGEDKLATVFKVGNSLTVDDSIVHSNTTNTANNININATNSKNHQHDNDKNKNNKGASRFKGNTSNILHNSVFYIPFLLINSFLIFMVTPDLVILFIRPRLIDQSQLKERESSQSELAHVCCGISYAMCNLLDGCIYVFFHNDVRKMFFYHVSRLRRRGGQMSG